MFFNFKKSHAWRGIDNIEALTHSNVNSRFDLRGCGESVEGEIPNLEGNQSSDVCFNKLREDEVGFWQVRRHFKAKGDKVEEGCLTLVEILPSSKSRAHC